MENLQLKVHTKVCKTCAAYAHKSELLEKGISDYIKSSEPTTDTAQLAQKILKEMDDSAGNQ